MTLQFNGTTGLTFNDGSSQATAASGFGFKNRIINGAMMIDQRNAGASVTPNLTYTLDRWGYLNSQTSKATVQQNAGSVTPPAGFVNYLGVTSTSAYSVTSTDFFFVTQPVEGFNVADLNWGTANAAAVTLSFVVRSSLTGTFGGSLKNSAGNRSYPFSFSISSANTWETKSVTIVGDTSGTWLKDNGLGIRLSFTLGSGSTRLGTAGSWAAGDFDGPTGAKSLVGTNGATFYITGVQLEKGSTATSFDYRPYGTELALCQRYFNYNNFTKQYLGITTSAYSGRSCIHPVRMRAAPTVTVYADGAGTHYDNLPSWTNSGQVMITDTPTYGTVIIEAVTVTGFGVITTTGGGQQVSFSWRAESEL